MDKALSNYDVLNLVGKPFGLVQANKLKNISDINDLFYNDLCLIIYNKPNKVGHWCCMKKNGRIISFFDPYGAFIDEQQKYTSLRYNPVLRELLRKYVNENKNNIVEYNDNQLQRFKKGVNTCGRWCATFMKYKNVLVDEFNDIFEHYRNQGYDLDELITKLTNNF